MGKGILAMQIKPSRLISHATPSFLYMAVANNGKPAAINALAKAIAAKALFALSKNTAMMYIWHAKKHQKRYHTL